MKLSHTLPLAGLLACAPREEAERGPRPAPPEDTAATDTAPPAADDTARVDADADGSPAGDDCDDGDADVHPGADERCDGADEDCDGLVDEDAIDAGAWHADADADGYGDAASPQRACQAPAGAVADASDCDDADAAVHPGADEHCDDVDEDCDGAVDEDAVDPTSWFKDWDGDGYGDPTHPSSVGCRPASWRDAANGEDCDDTAATRNPDADEVCRDGTDQDCDGDDTDCALLGDVVVSSAHTYAIDTETYGYDVALASDLDGDGVGDVLVGFPGGGEYGAVEVWFGAPTAAGGWSVDDHPQLLGVDVDGRAGASVDDAGDVDADGLADVLVGAPDAGAGAAFVLSGAAIGRADGSLGDALARFDGEAEGDEAGASVAGAGDLDGDGVADLAIGAPGNAGGGSSAGATYVVYGPIVTGASLASADVVFLGDVGSATGTAVAGVGDVDGDGLSDLAVAGTRPTATYVWHGRRTSGTLELRTEADVRIAADPTALWTTTVAGAGDVDADGLDDLLVGSSRSDVAASDDGAVFVFLALPASGGLAIGDAALTIGGDGTGDHAGTAVGSGDIDGDGFADVLVGEPDYDGSHGRVGLFYGGAAPAWSALATADATIGDGLYDYLGFALDGGSDLDGDGLHDMVLSAYSSYESSWGREGAVYVFLGGTR